MSEKAEKLKNEKAQRLASALRANLRRRKDQSRQRADEDQNLVVKDESSTEKKGS